MFSTRFKFVYNRYETIVLVPDNANQKKITALLLLMLLFEQKVNKIKRV